MHLHVPPKIKYNLVMWCYFWWNILVAIFYRCISQVLYLNQRWRILRSINKIKFHGFVGIPTFVSVRLGIPINHPKKQIYKYILVWLTWINIFKRYEQFKKINPCRNMINLWFLVYIVGGEITKFALEINYMEHCSS